MENGYRVWCKNNREWEKDAVTLLPDGSVYDLRHRMHLRPENHVVCKCSGQKDKNEKMLYQGDIVTFPHVPSFNYEIVFEDGMFAFKATNGNSVKLSGMFAQFCEIVGNIYETPELIASQNTPG